MKLFFKKSSFMGAVVMTGVFGIYSVEAVNDKKDELTVAADIVAKKRLSADLSKENIGHKILATAGNFVGHLVEKAVEPIANLASQEMGNFLDDLSDGKVDGKKGDEHINYIQPVISFGKGSVSVLGDAIKATQNDMKGVSVSIVPDSEPKDGKKALPSK